jgi:hypothetical protein
MVLQMLKYLKMADIQDDSIHYLWDDFGDQPEELFDEEFITLLDSLSQRAILAFMCGSAEWIVHRFAHLCDDPGPAKFVEAAWTMVIDVKYGGDSWSEYENEQWLGPVKKPIAMGLKCLESAIHRVAEQEDTPELYAAKLSNLVKYVMSDASPYERWCDQILKRLEMLYPYNFEEDPGDVVPRKAVDPEYDFKVENTEVLVNDFLRTLDYKANRFLRTPESMLRGNDEHEPFEGSPYVFNIEADRNSRR